MTRDRLYLFDTTLRDGAQTQGVDFSVEDKRQIALALDSLGLDYIEGGWPGANPTDTAFFAERPPLKHARFTAFGMTKRSGRSASNDPALAQVLDAPVDSICLVGKTSSYQVDVALEIPRDENIDNIAQSIAAIATKKREALLDAEHFFDGYQSDPDYALACIKAAHDAGAAWIVLCDTNGGNMPETVYRIVSEVKSKLPGAALGIHAHNDTEQAVAVSLAAVRGGVRQVQGTLNGLGERCGNANLCSLIPNLMLKEPFASRFETGITRENLARLIQVSRLLDEILNRAPDRHAPYVGPSAFTHKGGLHSSAVLKDPATYEHVPPETVGNKRVIPVPDYFEVESFRVSAERKKNPRGEFETVSEGVVKLNVAGQNLVNVATGNGPVNALDAALRKDLGKYSSFLADLRLVDYKVRILTSGTEAVTRVMVESLDGGGRRWSTVGVSPNIVDASFEALTDSIIYKLLRDGAKV
jgi:2-isopropylmalate synthase